MADTSRELTALLALFPDNTTGQITPQNLRDLAVSMLSGYGCLSGTTEGSEITSESAVVIDQFSEESVSSDDVTLNADDNDGRIAVSVEGDYLISVCASLKNEVTCTPGNIAVFKNGVVVPGLNATLRSGVSANQITPVSIAAIVHLEADDYVDVRGWVATSGDLLVKGGSFFIKRVG